MNIIFLDIDGVLNRDEYRRQQLRQGDYSVILEDALIGQLQTLVERSGALIVLISSWRKFWRKEGSIDSAGQRMDAALGAYGLTLWDKTPVLKDGTRSDEVEQWLREHPFVDQYVILDDKEFCWSARLRQHWIACCSETGLTPGDVNAAADVLSGNLLSIPQPEPQKLRLLNRLLRKFRK